MNTPSEPAGWSRAELEALRAVALAATPGEWRQGKMGDPVGGRHVVDLGEPPKAPFVAFTKGQTGNGAMRPWPAAAVVHSDLDNTPNDAAHIATFDPPTVIRLIDAIMALAPPCEVEPSVPDFEKRVHPIQRAEFAEARGEAEADILAALAPPSSLDGGGAVAWRAAWTFTGDDGVPVLRSEPFDTEGEAQERITFLRPYADRKGLSDLRVEPLYALAAAPLPVGEQGVMADRCTGTDTEATTSPSSAGSVAGQWRCTRCGRDEIDARANGCVRGPCPMESV